MPSTRALAGHVVAFSGRLESLSRKQALELAVRSGGVIDAKLSERTTLLVVGIETAGDEVGDPIEPAAPARSPRLQVVSEDEFCRLVGRVSPSELRQHYYAWRAIRARYPAVRDDHLRYLEKWGLLRSVVRTPADTYYGFADVTTIKQANLELEQGVSFRAVVRSLAAARDGQLLLDFRSEPGPVARTKVVPLAPRQSRAVADARLPRHERDGPVTEAEARFLDAERLDSGETIDLDAAMQAYRDAVALDPLLAPAIVNLGNLHYALDQLAEAQALYVQAALVDPECVEAHFNLGNIHHDLGRFEQAVLCYEEALRLSPGFADAHFYLAVTLEKLGRSHEARGHWQRYRALAPEGEWVDLAEEFSD